MFISKAELRGLKSEIKHLMNTVMTHRQEINEWRAKVEILEVNSHIYMKEVTDMGVDIYPQFTLKEALAAMLETQKKVFRLNAASVASISVVSKTAKKRGRKRGG